MRRTFAFLALALASLAAAAVAALFHLAAPKPPPAQATSHPGTPTPGALAMRAMLERLYLPEEGSGTAYLQIDLAGQGEAAARPRVPVNAVLILDRSGSMHGAKIERARDAARALVQALGPEDRLAVIEFSSGASVLVPSSAPTAASRARALAAIERVEPQGGTNMAAAFDAAAPELRRGRAPGRVDKVFLASDGQANEGISDPAGLLALARRDFGSATLSTFGVGDDYDEDLMSALAAQAGGRARYIDSPRMLAGAFRAELDRAAALVARGVRLRVTGLSGASVTRVFGYEADSGWVHVPDFAAGEERRVLARLAFPAGHGVADLAAVELAFEDARGETRTARAVVQATFTSDAALLARPATEAAASGAKAEMAEVAAQAARFQEKGQRKEARERLSALGGIARSGALAAPASAPEIARAAAEYETGVQAIEFSGDAATKRMKEKVFDAVRAPAAGW